MTILTENTGAKMPERVQGTGSLKEKQLQTALAESDGLLSLFIERAPIPIAVFDTDMRYLAVSLRYAKDYGVRDGKEGGLIGRCHYDVFPKLPEHWLKIHRRVLAGETHSAQEDPFPHADGGMDWIRWEMTPWYRADGTIGGAMLFSEFVTERVLREAALRISEARFRAAIEATQGIIWTNNAAGEMTGQQIGWSTLTGQTQDEYQGYGWSKAVHPEDAQMTVDAWNNAVANRTVFAFEHRVRRHDGEWRNFSIRAVPVFSQENEIVEWVGVHTDITDRKRYDATIRQSEEEFRALGENLPTLCWMANPDGWIFWYNRGWYDYTGTSPEQMEGWGWQSVHDKQMLPKVLQRWQESIAEGKPFEMTFPLRGADGVFRPFLTRVTPLRGAGGELIRWFGTNTDISEERSHAEALERLVEERTAALLREVDVRRSAEEALRRSEKLQLVGQLTGGVAHDFSNLLQVVTGGVRLLRSPNLTDERKTVLLDAMERSVRDGAELVNRLLSFARKQPLDPQPFDLGERLRASAELLRRTFGSNIQIKIDVVPGLWPALADSSQFDMALLNLAVNARDAMVSGGVLTFSARNDMSEGAGKRVCVIVEDTGVGMPSAVLARVFEPYFTTKEVGKGTGLGLSQVQGFAQQSGGDVVVESELGRGTKITIFLPCAGQGPASLDLSLAESATSGAAVMRALGKVVLVVDDNPEVAAFAAAMLEGLGYTVKQAGTAPEALKVLDADGPIDAVFSDVVMPGHINGADLASILRQRHSQIAIVMTTGYTDQRDRLRELSVEVLPKPYVLDNLAAALERALHAASVRQSTQLAS